MRSFRCILQHLKRHLAFYQARYQEWLVEVSQDALSVFSLRDHVGNLLQQPLDGVHRSINTHVFNPNSKPEASTDKG